MSNNLFKLNPNMFVALYSLVLLNLDNNFIRSIMPGSFAFLNNIKILSLKENRLTKLEKGTLCELEKLQNIDLSFNDIMSIQFPSNLPFIQIKFHSPDLCCYHPRGVKCVSLLQPENKSFSCPRMLKMEKVFIWLLVGLVVFPNIIAPVYWRKVNLHTGRMVFLITLLHAVDTLVAVPLFVVAVVDVSYGERYKEYAAEWAQSMLCKGVAYIGYLTFILSTACFTLIMQQRYLGIAYPLYKREISTVVAVGYVLMNFFVASTCYFVTLIMESHSEALQLKPICFIYAHPLGGWKSNWFLSLYGSFVLSVIPATCFCVGTVRSLMESGTLIQHRQRNWKPAFKILVTIVIYILTCLSLGVIGVIDIYFPLPDLAYILMFITIFPLQSLTNPWIITYLPFRKWNWCGKKRGSMPRITIPCRHID